MARIAGINIPTGKRVVIALTYIHRIGRSGRYGRKGVAINLINDREVEYMKHIEEFYDTKINEMPQNNVDYIN